MAGHSVSSISQSSGINLSQIFSQESGSEPLTQSQLLAGGDVRAPGGHREHRRCPRHRVHGDGPAAQGDVLPLGRGQDAAAAGDGEAGFTDETYTVWIDGQHTVRKAVITEAGKTMRETITTTITSINQPVNIAVPAAGQTSPLPGGDLSGLSSARWRTKPWSWWHIFIR